MPSRPRPTSARISPCCPTRRSPSRPLRPGPTMSWPMPESVPGRARALSLEAHVIPFSVTGVAPATAGTRAARPLQIDGALFDRATTFQLLGPGGITVPAAAVDVQDASTAYATFDLSGPADGILYGRRDARGRRDDATRRRSGAAIRARRQLETYLSGPSADPGRGHWRSGGQYANTGDDDVGAPLIYVLSPSNTADRHDQSYLCRLRLWLPRDRARMGLRAFSGPEFDPAGRSTSSRLQPQAHLTISRSSR